MKIQELVEQFRDTPLSKEQITEVWESLGGMDSWLKTFGYQQFALAILKKAHNETHKNL